MPFRSAYLERQGSGPLRLEERIVSDVLKQRGIPATLYSQKQIDRRSLPLGDDAFIMGAMPAMHGAMKQLGIPVPAPNDYPDSLRDFFHRRIWRSTLRDLEAQVWSGRSQPVFAKPAERRKDFTGRVFAGNDDLYFLGATSRRQVIWCSDVVDWVSEYRFYVVDDQIVGMDHYAGNESVRPSIESVQDALRTYRASGHAPAAYGIDFGVLATGETALVEANDGYSLGAYGIAGEPYAGVLMTRWAELLRSRPRERGAP